MNNLKREEFDADVLYDDPRESAEIPDNVRRSIFWMNLAFMLSEFFAGMRQSSWLSRLSDKFRRLPICKDYLLIVSPSKTWENIVLHPHGWIHAFVLYFLPLNGVMSLLDGMGLYALGQRQLAEGMTFNRFSLPRVFVFEIFQAGLTLTLILVTAHCINLFGNACHRRVRNSQTLLLLLHAIGPLLLVQFFNFVPGLNVWITWLVGLFLSLGTLYHGLPRILKPDVPSAIGLFVSSAVTFGLLMFVGRLLTYLYLIGDFKLMDNWIGLLAGWLH